MTMYKIVGYDRRSEREAIAYDVASPAPFVGCRELTPHEAATILGHAVPETMGFFLESNASSAADPALRPY